MQRVSSSCSLEDWPRRQFSTAQTNRWRQNRIPFWQKDRWRKTGSLEPLLTLMWYFYFFNHGLSKVRLLIIWLIYDHFWKRFQPWNALILVPRIFWSKFLNGHWRGIIKPYPACQAAFHRSLDRVARWGHEVVKFGQGPLNWCDLRWCYCISLQLHDIFLCIIV